MEVLRGSEKSLGEEKAAIEEQLQNLQNTFDTQLREGIEKGNSELQKQLEDLTGQMETLRKSEKSLKAEKEKLEKQLAQNPEFLDSTKIQQLESEKASLEKQLTKANEQKQDLEDQIKGLTKRIKSLEKTTPTTPPQQPNPINPVDNGQNDTDLKEARDKVTTLENQVAELKETAETNETKKADLEKKFKQQKEKERLAFVLAGLGSLFGGIGIFAFWKSQLTLTASLGYSTANNQYPNLSQGLVGVSSQSDDNNQN